jgi:hypothetical protein
MALNYPFDLDYGQYEVFHQHFMNRLVAHITYHQQWGLPEVDGKEVMDELCQEAGVEVVLIEDARGSFGTPGRYVVHMLAEDEQAAVEFKLKWL